jgi:hypothetical protein
MLSYVLDAIEPSVDAVVLVVRPGSESDFEVAARKAGWTKDLALGVQAEARGSADAVAIGLGLVPDTEPCVVVWADQIGVSQGTVQRVAAHLAEGFRGLVLPLVDVEEPYVWFDAHEGSLVVHRRRDGDVSPPRGKSDVGTFGLWPIAGRACIAQELGERAQSVREADFVYVVPRLARLYGLEIVDVDDPTEALGVNSPPDLDEACRLLAVRG